MLRNVQGIKILGSTSNDIALTQFIIIDAGASLGRVQPLRCTITDAAYAPALQQRSTGRLFTKPDRKPPTYASPAPLVSTSFSFGSEMIGYSYTCPFTATIVGSLPCVMTTVR